MLKLDRPLWNFCPFCGQKNLERQEEGRPIRFCPEHGPFYPHVAAAACAIICKEGQVLLVKRNHQPYKGLWMFPAGFIEYGEHPEETVIREVAEETGLTVIKTKLFEVLQSRDDARSPGHFAFFYLTTAKDGEFLLNREENTDISWFSLDKLPPIGFRTHQAIARRLAKGKISPD